MFNLKTQEPNANLQHLLERIIITEGAVPEGQVWEHNALPAIMQSWAILFDKDEMNTTVESILKDSEKNLKKHLVLGQFTKSFLYTLKGSADSIVFHFKPTMMYRVMQKPMHLFADNIEPMPEHLPRYDELLHIIKVSKGKEIVDRVQMFIKSCEMPETPTRVLVIEKIAQKIISANGNIDLLKLGKEEGISERSMQRYFLEYIGISPKAFKNIARFNFVTRSMEFGTNKKLTDLLFDAGYSDANHFTKDFKKIAGITPSQYYKGKSGYDKFFYGS